MTEVLVGFLADQAQKGRVNDFQFSYVLEQCEKSGESIEGILRELNLVSEWEAWKKSQEKKERESKTQTDRLLEKIRGKRSEIEQIKREIEKIREADLQHQKQMEADPRWKQYQFDKERFEKYPDNERFRSKVEVWEKEFGEACGLKNKDGTDYRGLLFGLIDKLSNLQCELEEAEGIESALQE